MAEWTDNRDEVTDEYRAVAKQKIGALWESIGFLLFRDGVQLLDTSMQEPLDLLDRRRAQLMALSAAYQKYHRGKSQAGTATTAPRTPAAQGAVVSAPAPAAVQHISSVPGLLREQSALLAAQTSLTDLERDCAGSGWSPSERATALSVAAQATHLTGPA
ncbi:hypothetical protein ACFXGT_37410 [Streptomyces sp. NPDC059352]|uniref:hypothetical protein n=1 Tax=Streptomyces sp. NPDC059352 TaxID=3346810 RepID=UPI0036983490